MFIIKIIFNLNEQKNRMNGWNVNEHKLWKYGVRYIFCIALCVLRWISSIKKYINMHDNQNDNADTQRIFAYKILIGTR